MSRNNRETRGEPPFSTEFSSISTSEEPFFVEIGDQPDPEAGSPPAAQPDEPPQWFRGQSNREQADSRSTPAPPPAANGKSRPHSRRVKAPVVSADEDGEEALSWQEKLKGWISGEGGAGYGISVILHVVLLLAMSLWMLTAPPQEELVTTLEQTEVADVASIQDVEIEKLEDDFEPEANNPLVDAAPLSAPDLGLGSNSLLESISGGSELKIPSMAVTKGSFTVWTEPEDPMPGQQYTIWIQVRLKNEIKRYPRRDLSGSIVGTDGYKDYFGGPTEPGYLPIKDNTVRYEALIVPGASELVKDIINVESKILKEKQQIELVF